VVGNAWSTVKGRGYVKTGEEVLIERDDPNDPSPTNIPGFSGKTNGIVKQNQTKIKGKTKQLSLATMMKVPPPKASKKKVDTVVRLSNTRGFGLYTIAPNCFRLADIQHLPQSLAASPLRSHHGFQSSSTWVKNGLHLIHANSHSLKIYQV
jgi:hypothetical protein